MSSDVAVDPFVNTQWSALHSTHAEFALRAEGACKYPADVAPFAAVACNDEASLRALHSITLPDEAVWLVGERPASVPGFVHLKALSVSQMTYPMGEAPRQLERTSTVEVKRLTGADAPAMVGLTDIAFPGFFRPRTYAMGTYYGMFAGGQLIAMAGERMAFDHCREISGVCTRPGHTGQGLAATLIVRLMEDHFAGGLQSYLHVSSGNARAISLYQRLGFSLQREFIMHCLQRVD